MKLFTIIAVVLPLLVVARPSGVFESPDLIHSSPGGIKRPQETDWESYPQLKRVKFDDKRFKRDNPVGGSINPKLIDPGLIRPGHNELGHGQPGPISHATHIDPGLIGQGHREPGHAGPEHGEPGHREPEHIDSDDGVPRSSSHAEHGEPDNNDRDFDDPDYILSDDDDPDSDDPDYILSDDDDPDSDDPDYYDPVYDNPGPSSHAEPGQLAHITPEGQSSLRFYQGPPRYGPDERLNQLAKTWWNWYEEAKLWTPGKGVHEYKRLRNGLAQAKHKYNKEAKEKGMPIITYHLQSQEDDSIPEPNPDEGDDLGAFYHRPSTSESQAGGSRGGGSTVKQKPRENSKSKSGGRTAKQKGGRTAKQKRRKNS